MSCSRVTQIACPSLTSGFQVIARLSDASEAQKLYVNQSMDPHTQVTVEVERDGLHQVTIFPIREGRGILDSNAETHAIIVELSITGTTAESDSPPPSTQSESTHYLYLLHMYYVAPNHHAATVPAAFNSILTTSQY